MRRQIAPTTRGEKGLGISRRAQNGRRPAATRPPDEIIGVTNVRRSPRVTINGARPSYTENTEAKDLRRR